MRYSFITFKFHKITKLLETALESGATADNHDVTELKVPQKAQVSALVGSKDKGC